MRRSSKNMLAMSFCCFVIAITTGINFVENLNAKCNNVSNNIATSNVPNNLSL
jgi:hypothetical protein